MNITIFTHDRSLFADLKRTTDFDLTVSGLMSRGAKSADGSPLYEFVLSVAKLGTAIAANVFSAWLYEKIKGRSNHIAAKGVKARIEVAEIERCLGAEKGEGETPKVESKPDSE